MIFLFSIIKKFSHGMKGSCLPFLPTNFYRKQNKNNMILAFVFYNFNPLWFLVIITANPLQCQFLFHVTFSFVYLFWKRFVEKVVSFFQDSFLFFLVVRCLLLRLLRLMKNYNSKKEDLEEEDQRQDERNVIL